MKVILPAVLCLLSVAAYSQNLSIYCEDDPPFQQEEQGGHLSGFVVDTVREIQTRVGNTNRIELVPWARGLAALDKGGQVVLFSMGRTLARENRYQWVGPIHESVLGLYALKENPVKLSTLDEAKKRSSIAVYLGDIADQFLQTNGFTNLLRIPDSSSIVRMLVERRAELIVASRTGIVEGAGDAGASVDDFREVLVLLRPQIYVAMSKDMPASVVAKWNMALEAMKQDGTFERIYHKYLPRVPLPGPASKPKA